MTIVELPKFKKILIIRLSSLGDILLTTPFIRSIKNQFPDIELDYIVREEYSDVLKLNPYLNKVSTFSRIENDNHKILKEINNSKYDLVIDLQNNLRSKKVVSTLNIKNVKFDKRSFDKFLLVKFKINKLRDAPQIPVRYSQTISGFKLDEKGLDLFTDKRPSAKLEQKENLIGFCPGARHFTKRWPKEYYVELGKKLTANRYTIALFGGKIDIEICASVANEIPGAINLSNNDDILQTTADMKLCKAIVCNDSGLMHAASSVGTKVVTVFGSSVKEFGFTPYNCTNLILENNLLTCRPCSHIGRSNCPKKHFDCTQLIKPQFVFEKVISFITDK